jgi:hypothetical protein
MVVMRTWTFVFSLLLMLLPTGDEVRAQHLLFVGNSYTAANGGNNITVLFSQLAEEGVPAWDNVATTKVTSGGYTFKKHLGDATTPGKSLHTYLVGQPVDTYDYVILQEQSQTPGFYAANSPLWDDSLQSAIALDGLVAQGGADTVFFMTWGRRDGDDTNPALYPDYISMQLYLDQGYHLYAQETASSDRVTFLSPAGRAFQLIFEDLIAQGDDPLNPDSLFHKLYSGDGSHPSIHGSFLSAAVLYATLTGRNPEGLSSKPGALSTEDRDELLSLARRVVTDAPYDHFTSIWGPLPRYPWVEAYQDPASGEMSVGSDGPRTTIYLDSTAPPLSSLTLGATPTEAGRVGILDGASLVVEDSITVGAGGQGLLECLGGNLTAGSLTVGQGASASGVVLIDGGTLDVMEIAKGNGDAKLSMLSGQLRARSVAFGWEQVGGTWSLPVDGSNSQVMGSYSLDKEALLRFTMTTPKPDEVTFGALTVQGPTTLRGTIAIDTPGGLNLTKETQVILMIAESFATDDLNINLPPGSSWEIVPHQTVLFALKLNLVPSTASPVIFEPPPGPYDAPLTVTLSTAGAGTIHYTTDGSSVSQNSPSAPSPLTLDLAELGPHTLRAISINAFGIASQPTGGSYLLLGPPEVIATPKAGQYDPPLTVTLSTERANCTIYSTLDGSDPSTKAAVIYEEPLVLAESGALTLKARAVSDTGVEGPVLTVEYQIGDAPVVEAVPEEDVVVPDTTQPDTHNEALDTGTSTPPVEEGGCTQGKPPATPWGLILLGSLALGHRVRSRGCP